MTWLVVLLVSWLLVAALFGVALGRGIHLADHQEGTDERTPEPELPRPDTPPTIPAPRHTRPSRHMGFTSGHRG